MHLTLAHWPSIRGYAALNGDKLGAQKERGIALPNESHWLWQDFTFFIHNKTYHYRHTPELEGTRESAYLCQVTFYKIVI